MQHMPAASRLGPCVNASRSDRAAARALPQGGGVQGFCARHRGSERPLQLFLLTPVTATGGSNKNVKKKRKEKGR